MKRHTRASVTVSNELDMCGAIWTSSSGSPQPHFGDSRLGHDSTATVRKSLRCYVQDAYIYEQKSVDSINPGGHCPMLRHDNGGKELKFLAEADGGQDTLKDVDD